MQFEIVDNLEHPIRLTLEHDDSDAEPDEVDVVRATFREEIYLRAQRGNTGSISDFDRYVATEAEDAESDLTLKLRTVDDVAEPLERFHERTDDMVAEIPGMSFIPPYENDYITERFRLGQMALKLANEIREADRQRDPGPPVEPGAEADEIIGRFRDELDGGAFPQQ